MMVMCAIDKVDDVLPLLTTSGRLHDRDRLIDFTTLLNHHVTALVNSLVIKVFRPFIHYCLFVNVNGDCLSVCLCVCVVCCYR
jgi:hypothetical protein